MIATMIAGLLTLVLMFVMGGITCFVSYYVARGYARAAVRLRLEKATMGIGDAKKDITELVFKGLRLWQAHGDRDSKSWCEFRKALDKFNLEVEVSPDDFS